MLWQFYPHLLWSWWLVQIYYHLIFTITLAFCSFIDLFLPQYSSYAHCSCIYCGEFDHLAHACQEAHQKFTSYLTISIYYFYVVLLMVFHSLSDFFCRIELSDMVGECRLSLYLLLGRIRFTYEVSLRFSYDFFVILFAVRRVNRCWFGWIIWWFGFACLWRSYDG